MSPHSKPQGTVKEYTLSEMLEHGSTTTMTKKQIKGASKCAQIISQAIQQSGHQQSPLEPPSAAILLF